jgi:hypothetical protein
VSSFLLGKIEASLIFIEDAKQVVQFCFFWFRTLGQRTKKARGRFDDLPLCP